MSLINDMLKDLERTRSGKAAGPSLLRGVQAVTGAGRRGSRRPLLAGMILLAGLALGGGLRLLLAPHSPAPTVASAPPTVTTPAPATAPEPAPVVAATAPAAVEPPPSVAGSTPAPVEPPPPAIPTPAPVEPAVSAPQAQSAAPAPPPVAAGAAETRTAAATTPPAKVVAAPAPAATPAPAPAKVAAAPKQPAPLPVPVKSLPTAAVLVQEARGLLKNGQQAQAAERLEQALALEPAAFAPRDLLANLQLDQGRRGAAIELWRGGVKQAPTDVYWRKRLARALLEDGDGAGAVELLQGGAQPGVAADGEFHGLLAAAYQRQGDSARAAAVYRRLAEQEPRSGIWWLGLAIALEGVRDPSAARTAYQQALGTESLGTEARAFAAGRLSRLAP